MKEEFPLASEVVQEKTIVDDNMFSDTTDGLVIETFDQLKALYGQMGMSLGKFFSNSKKVLASLDESEISPNLDISELLSSAQSTPILKALGLIYSARNDSFTFKMNLPGTSQSWTKRTILSFHATLFDPLGLIMPVIIAVRIIFQNLWLKKYDWDNVIAADDLQDWYMWLHSVEDLPKMKIPRCHIDAENESKILERTLHIFVDASSDAFGAVCYLFCRYEDGKTSSRLIQSRARVAPVKTVTIPRLELMGAVIGKDLAIACSKVVRRDNVVYWTDSQNVLAWLRASSKQLLTFVANRIAKIQRATSVDAWHWIAGERNPADILSRGMPAGELSEKTLWWEGPVEIMSEPPEDRTLEMTEEASQELRRGQEISFQATVSEEVPPKLPEKLIDETRFSSWAKLVRIIAYCRRYVMCLKHETEKKSKPDTESVSSEPKNGQNKKIQPLTPQEIKNAENCLLRVSQAESYPTEYLALMKGETVAAQSSLRRLRPRLDENLVMRLTGRLRAAEYLNPDKRSPILLPKNAHITSIIVHHYHVVVNKHVGGTGNTLASLNEKYWLTGGRNEIRKILSVCLPCRRNNARPKHQEMSPLPAYRFHPEESRIAPFYMTGVDVAGPFKVNLGRGMSTRKNAENEHKRYFIIFVCGVYRCVHVELVNSISGDAFLQAFSRFLARRPRPKIINSDNGKNFVSASEILKELSDNLKKRHPELTKLYPDIEWIFNTPYSPHEGGNYERMIGCMKKALTVVLPSAGTLKEEELRTCLVVCEGLLNSRPLSYISSDPDDLTPLTPAHFLMQSGYADITPAADFRSNTSKFYERWLYIQSILDKIWGRFVREVVPQLHKINKWTKERRNVQVGDIVAVLEEKSRGVWPLGRVVEVFIGEKDNHVRRANVLCQGRIIDRSLSRLMVVLENSQQH